MRRALRSGPRREVLGVAAWSALFAVLLALRVALQRSDASPGPPLGWLRIGATALLVLLVARGGARAVAHRSSVRSCCAWSRRRCSSPSPGSSGSATQPDPGRAEQLLIALLGLHAVGAIVVSDELSAGTQAWRTGLWTLALSFGALTVTLLRGDPRDGA